MTSNGAEPQHPQPRLLIEEWLPATAIGVECMRERGTGQQPPDKRLHVWWARRPLTASRAAVLASVLPADFDRATFERLLGFGQTGEMLVQTRQLMDSGIQVPGGFNAPRAFTNTLPEPMIEAAHNAARRLWGGLPVVLDPMAGGGSIPLESVRLGFPTLANEYNPVACTVLEATVDYPFRFGPELADKARKWAREWERRAAARLDPFFPPPPMAKVHAYVYARTVPCPDTGAPTPLVPDWHLSKPKTGTPIVANPIVDFDRKTWRVEIREIGRSAGQLSVAPKPTYVKGKAQSIFTRTVIDGEYIKAMALQGKLGSELYAVVLKGPRGLEFRPAEKADRDAIAAAERELARLRPGWERDNVIPTERIPPGEKTPEALRKGITAWADMFSPRQLLAMGVLVEELRALRPAIIEAEGPDEGMAIEHLLAFVVDKLANYNAALSFWHALRGTMANVFDRHDFAFKPCHAEMALTGAGSGLDWAIDSVLEPWGKLAQLARSDTSSPADISLGSATALAKLESGSLTAVIVDPPYADNVQYSELADFFYVWLKLTQGHRRPEWFSTYLSENSQEAVVNAVRHIEDFDPSAKYPAGTKKAAKEEAERFYRQLMVDTFKEARRLLRDDGVLTVMFTHKAQSAWESLFGALVEAGFVITATWPVKTEAQTLNIAGKASAESTVILVARKRPASAGVAYFDEEFRQRLARAARSSAERLRRDGLNSVDQLVGSFGPAMEVFSRYRAVRHDTGAPVSIGEALDIASDAVIDWRINELMARGTGADLAGVEALGRYAVLCWDVLAAAQFRFNEAKLLGHAVGLNPEDLVKAGIAEKKSQNIVILPASRRRRGEPVTQTTQHPSQADRRAIHPNDDRAWVRSTYDGVQMLALAYLEAGGGAAGIGAARNLANRHGWRDGSTVARLLQALVLAAPRGVQVPGKGIARDYPEFLAWHALLQPLFGVDPPDWSEAEPMVREFPGFTSGKALLAEEGDADEESEDDEEAEDDDE